MIATPCAECGNPCWYYAGSFYRCRQCGYESLRDLQPYDRSERAYVEAAISLGNEESDGRAAGAPALGLSP